MTPVPNFVKFVNVNGTQIRFLTPFHERSHVGMSNFQWSCNKTAGLIQYFNSETLARITEKAMAPHSSTLAWKIPWMEEPGRLQSMGL